MGFHGRVTRFVQADASDSHDGRGFPGAKSRNNKAAVKRHTLLDIDGNISTFMTITDGSAFKAIGTTVDVMQEARGYLEFRDKLTGAIEGNE
jgi:hypothetical protein